jgi:hypothetical protein
VSSWLAGPDPGQHQRLGLAPVMVGATDVGVHNAFLVGAAVALAGAAVALITKKGTGTAAAHAGI